MFWKIKYGGWSNTYRIRLFRKKFWKILMKISFMKNLLHVQKLLRLINIYIIIVIQILQIILKNLISIQLFGAIGIL